LDDADAPDGSVPAETIRATASVDPADRAEFLPGIAVPLPDEAAILAAWERLSAIDIGVSAPTVSGLGMLAESVAFVAGVQAHPYPRPILSTRVVLIVGSHVGGVSAGPSPDPRNSVPLQQLASAAHAGLVTLEWTPAAAAIEVEDAINSRQLDAAMRAGWAEAERAADEGIELLILAAGGAGATAAAVAVISAISGYETSALLGRVVTPGGVYDDNAWMARALALRDAMHRVRNRDGDPRSVLAALGGADIAAATGLLLGAASRRLPVMIDGPVGAAAAMVANDFAPSVRRWLMLPDHSRNVAVIVAAEALELRPWLDLCLDLGEGATSLSALPLLQMALTLAGAGTPVQRFVGVAHPVEPTEDAADDEAPAEEEKPAPSPALTAPTTSIGARAKSAARPAPPKPTPAKTVPKAAKAAAAKKNTARAAGSGRGPAKSPGAKATGAAVRPGTRAGAGPAKPTDAPGDLTDAADATAAAASANPVIPAATPVIPGTTPVIPVAESGDDASATPRPRKRT
jgi:NaMN:DMB phosphoribosyltransferase